MTVTLSNMWLQLLWGCRAPESYIREACQDAVGKVALVPIYEYVCMSCESHFEELVGMSEPDPTCPDCGHEKVAKQFSAFVAHGTAGQPSFGGGGCCGGSCGCGH
jgi:putative FmdB family regulatory protein